jgi:hypothetical protein
VVVVLLVEARRHSYRVEKAKRSSFGGEQMSQYSMWQTHVRNQCPRLSDPTAESLVRYIVFGARPGSFLTAALSNDFIQVALRADLHNQHAIGELARFLEHYAPRDSYGSPTKMRNWQGLEADKAEVVTTNE